MTNKLISELAAVCDKYKTTEKLFIVSDFISGGQIVEAMVKTGMPALNLRLTTLSGLIAETAGSKKTGELLPSLGVELAVGHVFEALFRAKKMKYFVKNKVNRGLIEALAEALTELRLNNLKAVDLKPEWFVDTKKAGDLALLLNGYEKYLSANSYNDAAGLILEALQVLKSTGASKERIFVIRENHYLSAGEKIFLNAVSGKNLIILKEDGVCGAGPPQGVLLSQNCSENGGNELRYLFEPAQAEKKTTEPLKSISIFSAVGTRNEVKEIFARVLNSGKLDEAEIVYTDREAYADLIYVYAAKTGLGVTFAEGISGYMTGAGRVMLNLLLWVKSDYEDIYLRRILASSSFKKAKAAEEKGSRLAHLLRTSLVGWKRERYGKILERKIKEAEEALKKVEMNEEATDPDALNARIEDLKLLVNEVDAILRYIPACEKTAKVKFEELCASILNFLRERVKSAGPYDINFVSVAEKHFEVMIKVMGGEVLFEEAVETLLRVLQSINVGAEGPQPGKLHIAHYKNGGLTGRAKTFIVGMEESMFPEKIFQDPVLLDKERIQISKGLELSDNRAKKSVYLMGSLLSGLRGEVTASYPIYDIVEARKGFPASLLLQIYRIKEKKPRADYDELINFLFKELAGPGGKDAGKEPDLTSWWLSSLAGRTMDEENFKNLAAAYPLLSKGIYGKSAREDSKFTAFDGLVGSTPEETDPRLNGDIVSCSRLEKALNCRFAYFIRYVLKISPPEEIEKDVSAWLDSLSRGKLLHEVFKTLVKNNIKEEKKALAILEAAAKIWKENVPPPGETVYELEKKLLENDVRLFLQVNSHIKDKTVFCEEEFGYDGKTELAFPSGKIKVRGAIDRVDEDEEGNFSVWDYKTGSSFGYLPADLKKGDKKIQYCVYAEVAEGLLAKEGKKGKVKQSGYFFPAEKGMKKGEGGLVAVLRSDFPSNWKENLVLLFDDFAKGEFFASDKASCDYCEYAEVCSPGSKEGTSLAAEQAKEKRQATSDKGQAKQAQATSDKQQEKDNNKVLPKKASKKKGAK